MPTDDRPEPIRPLPYTDEELFAQGPPRTFAGEYLREIAFPLGGIGTGCVSLDGRGALVDWNGPVTVEAYTVAHRAGSPHIAHAACLTDDGRRTWGTVGDPAVLEAMTREEFCGRRGRIDGEGHLGLD